MKRGTSLMRNVRQVRGPAVMITFDDGGATQYSEGYVYMNSAGLKGTLYAVTDLVDDTGYVTTANLTTMYNAGWDIGNHTSDHTDLTSLSQGDAQTKLTTARDWLNNAGFTRASRHVGYPFGAQNATVLAAMDAVDMLTGRTITEALGVVPTHSPYTLNGYILDKTKSLAQAEALVDSAVSGNKLLTVYIHNINGSPGDNDLSIVTFQGFIDYIVSNGVPAITVSELYNGIYS